MTSTIGFARGAIVRKKDCGPSMLVVRGLVDRTVVVVCEGDAGGDLRLRDPLTATLDQVLAAETPRPTYNNGRE